MPTSNDTAQPANWHALHPSLERCYIGPPQGKSGTFPGTVFTLCKLLAGAATMSKDGHQIETDSQTETWILCSPGTRTQHFSDDAKIISIHISLGNPQNGAEWTGAPLICVPTEAAAEATLARLVHCQPLQACSPRQRLDLQSLELPITAHLELQQHSLELFNWALQLASRHGMHYQVPRIQDPRVQNSHQTLASLSIRQSFSRQELAAQEGLTAGQLDRLWRVELDITPNQYRDRQRLTYACEQLRRKEIPIKVIAAELGFRHLSQFSNWFNSRHGESPRSFRKRPGTS
ncbi:helix-turn-helix transcriptional regulator [Coraliomargarita algicola]|uniref:Helix-turn-helix transcriptional regulator n=1 Tax=Coraliomargarita algicola TaxID=3092156 RepID=A0ABZ0RMW6_9BACT|nr:helix-turn-helix transcriptional regulator [Coraliomargarita sp. J2-16]WPJ96852.1 helix-turn-helix transcriptional regulator [Coraliomargarita sp. J2-16]